MLGWAQVEQDRFIPPLLQSRRIDQVSAVGKGGDRHPAIVLARRVTGLRTGLPPKSRQDRVHAPRLRTA
jgi:hypothetical protein